MIPVYTLAGTDKTVTQQQKSALQAEVVELKKKADFYNNASINKWGEIWAKGLDEAFTKNAGNFIDTTNIVGAINQIVNKAFSEGGSRSETARIAATEVMRYRYPFGYASDNTQAAAEYQALIDEISTHELAGFERNRHRSKNRLYDYIYAKLSNTPKKPHIPRHERILKPVVNEILGKSFGYIPFKDFKGGRVGTGGSVGLQASKNSGQSVKVDLTVAGTPVTRLYGDKKQSKMTLSLPKKQEQESPVAQKMPETKISLDSPFMKGIMAEQYQETFGNVEVLGKVVPKKPITEEALGKKAPEKPKVAIANKSASPTEKFRALVPKVKIPGEKAKWNKVENEIKAWQRYNKVTIPPAFDRLVQDFQNLRVVPDVFTESVTEFVNETHEGLVAARKFISSELIHAIKGEPLQSKKAVLLLGGFIGTEAARVVLGEQTATSRYIQEVASDFASLSKKEQAKAVLKIYMGYKLPMVGIKLLSGKQVPKTFSGISNRTAQKAPVSLLKMYEHKTITKTQSFKELVIQRSSPAEIYHGYGELSKRQSQLLSKLPEFRSTTYIKKSDFTANDLAALTAKTGDEFAMFTLGSRRLIIRGNTKGVHIEDALLDKITKEKWRWSAHVHPGTSDLVLNASGVPGDRQMLSYLQQDRSLIINSAGRRSVFDIQDNELVSARTRSKQLNADKNSVQSQLKVKK